MSLLFSCELRAGNPVRIGNYPRNCNWKKQKHKPLKISAMFIFGKAFLFISISQETSLDISKTDYSREIAIGINSLL